MTIRPNWRFGLAAVASLLLGMPVALAQSDAPRTAERPWTDPPSREAPAQDKPLQAAPSQADPAPTATVPAPLVSRPVAQALRTHQASRPTRTLRRQRLAQPRWHRPTPGRPVAATPPRRRILAEAPPVGRFRDDARGGRVARIRAAQEAGFLVIRSHTIELPDGRRLHGYSPYDGDDD